MEQSHFKTIISISTGLGVAIWLISFLWNQFPVVSWDSVRATSVAITLVSLFWVLYFKWMWKWTYLNKLLYKPNIDGTWIGEFASDWVDSHGEGVPPGKFVLVIRQSWLTLSIRAFTEKQKTMSYIENLLVFQNDSKILVYLYSEKRSSLGNHGVRQGAAELELIGSSEQFLLEGDFWTQAKTVGFIRVRRVSASEHIESFQEALAKWPDGDAWEHVSEGKNC